MQSKFKLGSIYGREMFPRHYEKRENKSFQVIPYDRWVTTKQSDLEAEFLGQIIARKPSGAPWIPKIVVLGPPGAGKSVISDHLAEKFNLVKVDWKEIVRGYSKWNDAVAQECKSYLQDLAPLSEDATRIILDVSNCLAK